MEDCACYFCRDPDKDGDNPCRRCFSLPKPKRHTPPLGYRKHELRECLPCFQVSYLFDKFPFVRWLIRYNARWLISDIIAGLTVGLMVVPQGLAYASIANLPPRVSGTCGYYPSMHIHTLVCGQTLFRTEGKGLGHCHRAVCCPAPFVAYEYPITIGVWLATPMQYMYLARTKTPTCIPCP